MALLAVVILKLAYNDLLLLNTQLQDIYLLYRYLFRKLNVHLIVMRVVMIERIYHLRC